MNNCPYDIKELGFIPPGYGGVSVSILRLIEYLTEDGFIVGGFYTSENTDRSYTESPLFDLELDFSLKRLTGNFIHNIRVVRPYKILHSHYSLEHMFYMWVYSFVLRKKIVVTVHNSMVREFYSKSTFVNRLFLKLAVKSSYVSWIAVSEQVKEELSKLPVRFRSQISVIPAYIPAYTKGLPLLPMKLDDYIKRHQKNIVFYGHSFMIHNGVDVYGFTDALRVFSRLIDLGSYSVGFILCLVEDSAVNKIEELFQTARDLHISEKIYWQIGPLSEMDALWRQTDVYIRPTYTDGDSVAIREALDMGVQVVASDVCKRPNESIVYRYADMDDFVEKVKLALSRGRVKIAPDYSNYNKVKEIYCNLLRK